LTLLNLCAMNKIMLLIGAALVSFINVQAQTRQLEATKLQKPLLIDGALDEEVYENLSWQTDFKLNYPNDLGMAEAQTKVAVFFDEKYIYIAAICEVDPGQKRSVRTLRRDFDIDLNDNFTVVIDPLLDNTNGFFFSVSAAGVQAEALMHSGSRINDVWDNKWNAATKTGTHQWTAEIQIPLKTLRYSSSSTQWGMNFLRMDIAKNERSSWNPVPREFHPIELNFTGRILWTENLTAPRRNVALIPYATAGVQSNAGGANNEVFNMGTDAKVALSSSLNLDLTINPDFSQAEVDAQQINLDRFDLFFPERRNFFIENNDLFANFGFTKIRPFFSRRIGLSSNGNLIPIYFGARLSGKLNKDLRVGLLNVQTGTSDDSPYPNNYTVGCFQRQIGGSNLAGILVNRQGMDSSGVNGDYNRVLGLDYNILSKNNRWRGKVFYHQSFTDENKDWQYAHASWLMYRSPTWLFVWNHEFVNKDYSAEVGFVPREGRGYWRLEPMIEKWFYPKKGILNSHGPRFYLDYYSTEDLVKTDHEIQFSYNFIFRNTSSLNIEYSNEYLRLLNEFNPNPSDTTLFPTGEYKWDEVSIDFWPVGRKKLSFGLSGEYGTFLLGEKLTYEGSLLYRLEPYLQLSVEASFNMLRMPEPYLNDNLMLISPRIDVSFTKKLFFSSFVQFNDQANTMGINSRIQYRFKPMSDLFIVFNQNINNDTGENINRALVVKLSYWLNA